MNKKKIIILVIIAGIIILALWLIFKKPASKKELIPFYTPSADEIRFPLKQGSKGWAVGQVQKYLNSKGASLKVDNDWGDKTSAAVTEILKRDNISKDVFYKWNLDKI